MKHTLEDLIKAERALEAALVRTLTDCSRFRTAGNTDAVDVICRERLNLDKAQDMIRESKERLQALAEYQPARDAKIAKHEKAKQRGLWRRRHRLNVVERAELVELNARYGTYTGPADVPRGTITPADGYPPDWPKCPACGKPAMDGHITCGQAACNEGARRHEHAS
jgi:hypothetical protein